MNRIAEFYDVDYIIKNREGTDYNIILTKKNIHLKNIFLINGLNYNLIIMS